MSSQRTSTDNDTVLAAQVTDAASIDTLPSEILRKIFLLAIRAPSPTLHPGQHLSVFSEVNRYWRDLCLGSSELWTDIQIPFEHKRGVEELVGWTETWLKRSQPRLVDVSLDTQRKLRHTETLAIMRLLMEQLPRIRSLKLNGLDNRHFPDTGLIPSLRRAIHLEHLHLALRQPYFNVQSRDPEYDLDWAQAESTTLPTLRSLRLTGLDIFPFGPEHLTSFDMHLWSLSEDSLRQFASRTPLLERMTLRHLYLLEEVTSTDAPPISLPSLRYLSLSFRGSIDGRKFALALLSIPNLEYLQIINEHGVPDPYLILPNPASLSNLHTLQLNKVRLDMHTAEQRLVPSYILRLPCVKHLQLIATPGDKLFPEIEKTPKPIRRSRSIDRGADGVSSSFASLVDRPSPFRHREIGRWGFEIPYEVTLPSMATEHSKTNLSGFENNTSSSSPFPPFDTHSSSSLTFPHLTTLTIDSLRAQDVLWACELVGRRMAIKRVYLSKSSMRHLISSFTIERIDDESRNFGIGSVGGFGGTNANALDAGGNRRRGAVDTSLFSGDDRDHTQRSQLNFDTLIQNDSVTLKDPFTASSNLDGEVADSSKTGPNRLNRDRNELDGNGSGISEEEGSGSNLLRVMAKGGMVARLYGKDNDKSLTSSTSTETGRIVARIRTRMNHGHIVPIVDTDAERSGAPQGELGARGENGSRLTLQDWLRNRVEICDMHWDNNEFCASL
ncbi:hypothetical protein D9758_011348 [Tetrapyrgos nigripes]|uniref:F-box domain-containing protein n=1 Tax=Tetrapyrgos nigripes TaxID=182062 RepID=A0A8H5G892_9AGAR|nr:hypothetical protein D9758_011348 [Tetrapyrgos nigripes]